MRAWLTGVALGALVGGCVATVIAVMILAPPSQAQGVAPSVLQAQRFDLVDSSGVVRGRWASTEQGVTLRLLDARGAGRVTLALEPGQGDAGLILQDAQGQRRAFFVARPDSNVLMLASAQDGGIIAYAGTDGDAGAGVLDRAGKARIALAVDKGLPGVGVADSAGHTRAIVAVDADGSPYVELRDGDGRRAWQAP